MLFIFISLGAISLTPLCAFAEDSPRKSAAKGIKHYDKEEYDKAMTEFMAGLEKAPDRPELKYDLGTALYRMQQFPQAADAFNKAAQKNPKIAADAWFNLGNSMYEGQKFDDAVKAYKNALKLNHEDKDAKHNLEMALRAKKMQQQQQQSQSGQDSSGQKKQQQQQKQQDGQQQQRQQQQQQQQQMAQADSSKDEQNKPQPSDQNKMSKEEAMQLLQALESDEQDAQKEKLIRQFGEPKKVRKDW
jgi:tetratricopeptide (TPR) repeat protein